MPPTVRKALCSVQQVKLYCFAARSPFGQFFKSKNEEFI